MVWTSSDVTAGDDVLATDHNTLRADVLEVFDSAVPLGSVTMWAGGTGDVPDGWELCDGSAINRTTYSDLYDLLGTTFGSGDGSTTFNVPDMRDRFVVGAGSSYSRNSKGGSNSNNLAHTHSVNSHNHTTGTHSHTVSSHRHYTGAHSHGNGDLRAQIVRTSTYNMFISQAASSSWTANYLINLYNSSPNGTGGLTSAVDVLGSTSSADAGYTDYQAPSTNSVSAGTTGSTAPSTGSGGSSSQENRPPYIGLYYIIKVE